MLIETAFCLTSTRWKPFTVQRLLIPAPVPHQSQQFLKQTDVDGNSDSDICFWVVGRQRLSRGTAGEVWIMWSSTVSLQEGDRCLSIQLPVFFVVSCLFGSLGWCLVCSVLYIKCQYISKRILPNYAAACFYIVTHSEALKVKKYWHEYSNTGLAIE